MRPISSEFKEKELFKCRLYELSKSQKNIIVFQTGNEMATEASHKFNF